MDTEEIKINIQKPYVWTRFAHMVVLFVAFRIIEIILYAVIILQFLSTMLTTKRFTNLDSFSKNLTLYMKNIMLYLSFNQDNRPYPFADWEESIK